MCKSGSQIRAILDEETLEKIEQLCTLAEEIGITMSQMSLSWILQKSQISSVIIGASNVTQIEENIKASEIELPPSVLYKIDSILKYKPFNRSIG